MRVSSCGQAGQRRGIMPRKTVGATTFPQQGTVQNRDLWGTYCSVRYVSARGGAVLCPHLVDISCRQAMDARCALLCPQGDE